MKDPIVQRLMLLGAGIGCFVAAYFLRDYSQYLVPAGAALVGWAKAAPGHGVPPLEEVVK